MTFDELQKWLVDDLQPKPYRAKQIFTWLHFRRIKSFAGMTDLSKSFRSLLEEKASITLPGVEEQVRAADGTVKYLLSLPGGHAESVIIPDPPRNTACLSTQYGCRMGCSFCMTGSAGYHGDITSEGIVAQLYAMADSTTDRISNVVLMGMGEPMDNWDNVSRALDIISDDRGICIGQRKITVSTVGIPGGIGKLIAMNRQYGLAVSLHSAIEEVRRSIIPSAAALPLDVLHREMLAWTVATGRRVTLEYCLIAGINDSLGHARALADYAEQLPCKINLLVYNPVPGMEWQRPSEKTVEDFMAFLYPRCQAVTLRRSRGGEVAGACGQLGASLLSP